MKSYGSAFLITFKLTHNTFHCLNALWAYANFFLQLSTTTELLTTNYHKIKEINSEHTFFKCTQLIM